MAGDGFISETRPGRVLQRTLPSLRKLEQFDQIERKRIWAKIKGRGEREHKEGVIRKENELVGDTTHYYAYSGFETVVYKDENGKEQKK